MPGFATVLLPATDLAASRELYRGLLGMEPTADTPYYVGFDVDGQQIGLVPGATVVRPHLHVPDMDAAVQRITKAGGSVIDQPHDVGDSRLVAVVRDMAGAEIGLIADSVNP